MKKRNYVSMIFFIFIISILVNGCIDNADNPIGPPLWIVYSDTEGINWDNYFVESTIMDLTFNGAGNVEGFDGWMSGNPAQHVPAANVGGKYVMFRYDNIQNDSGGNIWVSWSRNFSSTSTNLWDLQGEGEILAFEFKARCSNDGITYKPQQVQLRFGVDWDSAGVEAGDTNIKTPGDWSSCYYSVPGDLPYDHWTNVRVLLSDLVRSPWSMEDTSQPYHLITTDIWMRHVKYVEFNIPETALSPGKSGIVFIDDFRIVLYKNKKYYPTY